MLTSAERTVACWLLALVICAGYALCPAFRRCSLHTHILRCFASSFCRWCPWGGSISTQIFSLDWKVWQIVMWQLFVLPALILSAAHLAASTGR